MPTILSARGPDMMADQRMREIDPISNKGRSEGLGNHALEGKSQGAQCMRNPINPKLDQATPEAKHHK
eukprot:4824604-Karenia_brevis.AAC.1